MLTRRPHNLGTVPRDHAPDTGDITYHAGRSYRVTETRPVLWRASGDPVPRTRVYGWPIPSATQRPSRVSRVYAALGVVAMAAALVLAAVSTPGAIA